MKEKFIKIISFLILSSKKRKAFRNKFKSSIILNNGNNNILRILDKDGNITEKKYINNLSISFEGDNNYIEAYENLDLATNLNICCKGNNLIKIGYTEAKINISLPFSMSQKSKLIIGKNLICCDCQIFLCDEEGLSVTIGNDCLFSSNIIIRPSDGHTILNTKGEIINEPQGSIHIGDHCWLGLDCCILKDSFIPDNTIVGAKSVYTKASSSIIEEHCLYAGNPARLRKRGVTWALPRTDLYKIKENIL